MKIFNLHEYKLPSHASLDQATNNLRVVVIHASRNFTFLCLFYWSPELTFQKLEGRKWVFQWELRAGWRPVRSKSASAQRPRLRQSMNTLDHLERTNAWISRCAQEPHIKKCYMQLYRETEKNSSKKFGLTFLTCNLHATQK